MIFLQFTLLALLVTVNALPFREILSNAGKNGTLVDVHEFPYLVQVIVDCPGSWSTINLGVILSAKYVLSADSDRPPCNYSVWVNQDEENKNGVMYQIESMHVNNTVFEGYDNFWSDLNMFLFKLSEPIKLGYLAQPITISDKVVSGDKGTLIDLDSERTLYKESKIYKVNVTAFDVNDCRVWDNTYVKYKHPAEPEGSVCTIDPFAKYPKYSSSILVINGRVAAWQFALQSFNDNHILYQLNLFNELYKYNDWIKRFVDV
ncbi:hypothetical protein QAD02_017439 [Eretmocerus hayati]|uniref:Uncharacterized protein n=1 Tax=Eretmocerus hayati TaxID=131215 RepID=A0ACC2PDW0_9HYME|nr:hypothetical protein QAD02_017439 [Eretmocerus hayati]